MPARNEQKVDQYRTALAAGDVVTQHELIQFAKHDEDLAAQFIALEDEVFADVPAVVVDVDRVRARILGGQRIQAMLERTEAWVYGAETGIRAFFRYWPLIGAIVFGVCLFLMGRSPSDVAYRWLFGLAAVSLGSIAVVCASSLWHRRPTQRDTVPIDQPDGSRQTPVRARQGNTPPGTDEQRGKRGPPPMLQKVSPARPHKATLSDNAAEPTEPLP